MSNKQKRLQEVYDHLRRWYGIHTQTDFANSMRYSRNAISLALNGNEKYLTDSLFKNICEAYPGMFNLDYLLTGNGSLLAEQVIHDDGVIQITEQIGPLSQKIDQSSLVNAVLAAKDEAIESLRKQLEAKDMVIQAKDELIAALRKQITLLHNRIDEPFQNYPFETGVAEDRPKVIDRV